MTPRQLAISCNNISVALLLSKWESIWMSASCIDSSQSMFDIRSDLPSTHPIRLLQHPVHEWTALLELFETKQFPIQLPCHRRFFMQFLEQNALIKQTTELRARVAVAIWACGSAPHLRFRDGLPQASLIPTISLIVGVSDVGSCESLVPILSIATSSKSTVIQRHSSILCLIRILHSHPETHSFIAARLAEIGSLVHQLPQTTIIEKRLHNEFTSLESFLRCPQAVETTIPSPESQDQSEKWFLLNSLDKVLPFLCAADPSLADIYPARFAHNGEWHLVQFTNEYTQTPLLSSVRMQSGCGIIRDLPVKTCLFKWAGTCDHEPIDDKPICSDLLSTFHELQTKINELVHKDIGIQAICCSNVRMKGGHAHNESCIVFFVRNKGVLPLGCDPLPRSLTTPNGKTVFIDVHPGVFKEAEGVKFLQDPQA